MLFVVVIVASWWFFFSFVVVFPSRSLLDSFGLGKMMVTQRKHHNEKEKLLLEQWQNAFNKHLKVAACDPGERTFLTVYVPSLGRHIEFGKGLARKIDTRYVFLNEFVNSTTTSTYTDGRENKGKYHLVKARPSTPSVLTTPSRKKQNYMRLRTSKNWQHIVDTSISKEFTK
jgi:hypothetical protein